MTTQFKEFVNSEASEEVINNFKVDDFNGIERAIVEFLKSDDTDIEFEKGTLIGDIEIAIAREYSYSEFQIVYASKGINCKIRNVFIVIENWDLTLDQNYEYEHARDIAIEIQEEYDTFISMDFEILVENIEDKLRYGYAHDQVHDIAFSIFPDLQNNIKMFKDIENYIEEINIRDYESPYYLEKYLVKAQSGKFYHVSRYNEEGACLEIEKISKEEYLDLSKDFV